MSRQLAKDMLTVLREGFAPYEGVVEPEVFERLECADAGRACWMTKAGRYLCLGCERACAVTDGAGFQPLLPARKPAKPGTLAYALLPGVSAEQVLKAKKLLRVDEAAWILGVSPRHIYDMERAGKLVKHLDQPFRVTSESVRAELDRLDV